MMVEIQAGRIFQTPADGHYFFGYFNTPQVSGDDKRLLALKTGFIDRVPAPTDHADVGFFDLDETRPIFNKLGETSAFNWQQGCVLQFCGPDYTEKVIYNTFDDEKFVSEVVSISTRERRTLSNPVYTVFPNGAHALTLDFARHYWCRRGYSYGNVVDETKNRPVVEGDGIWLMDLANGALEQIIAIEDMLALNPVSSMNGATHYVEHMTINPSGTKFAFLHRWKHPGGGIHSRLCVADRDGRNVRILNDSGRMSHFCWRTDDNLIGYGGIANRVNSLRKSKALLKIVFQFGLPLYHALVKDSSSIAKRLTGDSYIEIDTRSGRIVPIATALRAEDGHPSMIPGTSIFVTDIYARAKHDQKPRLYAFDLEDEKVMLLDELESIAEFDETPLRCDLHPRVSPSGKIVTIDTMDQGVRGVFGYTIEVQAELGSAREKNAKAPADA